MCSNPTPHGAPNPTRVSGAKEVHEVLKGLFTTHIIDCTYGTIGKHNDAILLANWTRFQFVARRHIQRFGRRWYIGNVCDSFLDDLDEE